MLVSRNYEGYAWKVLFGNVRRVAPAMMLFLFTILLIFAAAASLSYFITRRKSLPQATQISFDSPISHRSLFAPDEEELRLWQKEQDEKLFAEKQAELRQDLLTRAELKDYNTLLEAKVFGDWRVYDELFELFTRNDSDKLADFVSRNALPVKAELVDLSLMKLKAQPSLETLIKFLHLSALTNSAEAYLSAIETAEILWHEKQLSDISAEGLVEILESHYWLLAGEARVSGAGYLLKEKLASVRREILESFEKM